MKVEITPDLRFKYAAGRYGSLFLKALKQGIFLASKCQHCGTMQAPPRTACGACFKETGLITEVGPQGTLLSYTQVSFPFIDPFTGETRPVPYCYGMIQLDGTDNAFQHFIAETDMRNLSQGMRLEPVFRERREGTLYDILHFKKIGQPSVSNLEEEALTLQRDGSRLNDFFSAFNQSISTKEFKPLLELFSDDAELTIQLLGKKHFKGKNQIEQAFRGLPRRSSLTLLEETAPQDGAVKGRFELRGLPLKIRGNLIVAFNSEGKIRAATLKT